MSATTIGLARRSPDDQAGRKVSTYGRNAMLRRHLATCLATALIAFSVPALAQTTPAPLVKEAKVAAPKRILFIGNSLMYYSGGLQTHLHRMAGAGSPPIDLKDGYKSVHITGANLTNYPIDFLVKPGNVGVKEPFELVVFASNSLDASSEQGKTTYLQKTAEWVKIIRAVGAEPVLYWLPATVKPHPLAGSDLGAKTEEMMLKAANENNVLVVPVALAFREAYRQRPDIKLQVYDGNHPTVAGQYLAAATAYATFYKQSPVGNPYDYFGALDADTKAFVQKIANDTVKSFFGR